VADQISLELALPSLAEGCVAITKHFGGALAEAAAVCLHEEKHQSPVTIVLNGKYPGTLLLTWPPVTDQMVRGNADPQYATELGAYGIAILVVKYAGGFAVIQRSVKGTGFDYWLGAAFDAPPFQSKARLEVSGIRSGDDDTVRARVRTKEKQTKQSDDTQLSALVVVVEFGKPRVDVAER